MSGMDDFQQALQQLRADFARQVPDRLREAQDRLQECLATPGDDAPLRELHRVIHKLAGSAGTFGMRELGERARALEEVLDTLLANPQRSAADFATIEQGLRLLAAQGSTP